MRLVLKVPYATVNDYLASDATVRIKKQLRELGFPEDTIFGVVGPDISREQVVKAHERWITMPFL